MNKRSVLAVSLAVALSACSGGGGRSIPPLGSATSAVSGTPVAAPVLKLVGVGDSLTAGVQSNGLMGADIAPNPYTAGGSPFPIVQATQTHGFWALLWAQANSRAINNPSSSPLPLIAPPGLGQILVPADPAGDLTSISTPCGANNAIAYSFTSALGARLSAGVVPSDVAIPGQTVHEALYQIAPQSGCGIPADAGVFGGLANIVAAENNMFYPILGNFPRGTTQVAAAAGLHGTIDTVWLGSNDLLKFANALGALPPTDPAALRTDVVAIVKALQASGAKVAVANLFDVLDAAFYIAQPLLPQVFTTRLTPVVGAAAAAAAGPQLAAEVDAKYGLGSGGYLTVSGLSRVLGAVGKGQALPQLGGGDFVPDALAAQIAALNTAYNAAIAAAVSQTGAVLVDVHTPLAAAHSAGGIPISAKCCGFLYGEGFFSLDGVHPSNTGYAVLANIFIKTLDTSLGTSIPAVDLNAVYAADIYAPH
jgi:hypothetical protein